jgi:N-hydroxyarylamine O-acetyltransferase
LIVNHSPPKTASVGRIGEDVAEEIDLGAYFARIGYAGPRAATLDVLKALHALHPAAIAFENLDPLLGRRVHLEPAALEKKLVASGRGGYCFEHNGLFAAALTTLGFRVTGLAARVYVKQTPGRISRSHMVLLIELPEGRYIADVGFGGWTLSAPLRLDDNADQETPHGPFRMLRDGEAFEQQTLMDGQWTTLYRFTLEEQLLPDYEVSNWYCSSHPESRFTTELMVARVPQGLRLGLMNRRFSIHHPDGRVQRHELKSAEEIAEVLEKDFAIRLPEPRAELLAALARLPAS